MAVSTCHSLFYLDSQMPLKPFLALVLSVAILQGLAYSEGLDSSGVTKAVELENACLKYRNSITEGYVAIEIRSSTNETSGAMISTQELRIWFKEGKLRCDSRRRTPKKKWTNWSTVVVDGDKYIHIPEESNSGGTHAFQAEYGDAIKHFGIFHPRWVGMGVNPEPYLHHDRYGRAVGTAALLKPNEVIRIDDSNTEIWKIGFSQILNVSSVAKGEFRPIDDNANRSTPTPIIDAKKFREPIGQKAIASGSSDVLSTIDDTQVGAVAPLVQASQANSKVVNTRAAWISPNQGHSLVRALVRHESPGNSLVQSVDIDYLQYGVKGIWFPSEVRRRDIRNGTSSKQRVMLMKDVDFDRPISDSKFMLDGLDLAEGRKIFDRTRGPVEITLVVCEGQILELPSDIQIPVENVPSTAKQLLLIGNAVLLAILSAIALRRFLRRKYS